MLTHTRVAIALAFFASASACDGYSFGDREGPAPADSGIQVVGCVVESSVDPERPSLRFGPRTCEGGKEIEVSGNVDASTLKNAASVAAEVMSCDKRGVCRHGIETELLAVMTPEYLLSVSAVFQGVLFSFSRDGHTIVELLVSDDGRATAAPTEIDPTGA